MFAQGRLELPARVLRAATTTLMCAALMLAAASGNAASLGPLAEPAPTPAPNPVEKELGPFDAAVFHPLVAGATWRYTLAVEPPMPFQLEVDERTRRVNGITTHVLRTDGTDSYVSLTADEAGLRLHEEGDDEATLTYSPPAVLVESGAKAGDVRRRTGEAHFRLGRDQFTLSYDTRSEVIGTESLRVDGRIVSALRVRTRMSVFGLIGTESVIVEATAERWLTPHVGLVRERFEIDGEATLATLDFAFIDPDEDEVSALDDNCREARNPDQRDSDLDGAGDACDADDDNDGTADTDDAFPTNPREQTDSDRDGVGNNADRDDDNDGQSDTYELRFGLDPLDSGDAALDSDGDGLDNLTEFQRGRNPRVNEAAVIPVLLDVLLVD